MRFELRINGLVEESIVDGPGMRFVVFTQGCPHRCQGCHNPESHALDGGYVVDTAEILDTFLQNPLLHGMTFSGGEPFMQAEALCFLAEQVKASSKSLVIYTGYTCEVLARWALTEPAVDRLLTLADILIDGPYREDRRNLDLAYRGSANQRLLYSPDIRAIVEGHPLARLELSPTPSFQPAPALACPERTSMDHSMRPFRVWPESQGAAAK